MCMLCADLVWACVSLSHELHVLLQHALSFSYAGLVVEGTTWKMLLPAGDDEGG